MKKGLWECKLFKGCLYRKERKKEKNMWNPYSRVGMLDQISYHVWLNQSPLTSYSWVGSNLSELWPFLSTPRRARKRSQTKEILKKVKKMEPWKTSLNLFRTSRLLNRVTVFFLFTKSNTMYLDIFYWHITWRNVSSQIFMSWPPRAKIDSCGQSVASQHWMKIFNDMLNWCS